jgi:PAS domain S-box-containing protein
MPGVPIKEDEQKEIERLKSILRSLPHHYLIIDALTLEVKESNINEPSKLSGFRKCFQLLKGCTMPCNEIGQKCTIHEVVNSGKPSTFEQVFDQPDGSKKYYDILLVPLISNDGTVNEVFEYCTDISDRKKVGEFLIEQKQFLDEIFHSIQEGIGIVDVYENITFCNPAFGEILETPETEIIGKNLSEIFDPNLFPFFQSQTEIRKSGKNSEYELLYKTKNGKNKYLRIYVSPRFGRNGNYIGAIGTMLDITQRFDAEQQLVNAKEKAEESERLKSVFLANMTNEIRTPLNGIIGFAELLDKPTLDDDKRKFFIRQIQSRGHELLKLINDIIDISKIESGMMNINEANFSFDEVIDDLIAIYKSKLAKLQKSHVLVQKAILPEKTNHNTVSDIIKVKQVLINLLENAIKFTEKGFIEIGYKIVGNEIVWHVKDTGIGIPRDQQNVIFERFRQLDETINRVYKGIGLGLAICNAFVQLLKGKIWVESEIGFGSTFFFTIPYKPVNIELTDALSDIPFDHNFTGKQILIVEDNPVSSFFLQETLSATGAKLYLAADGRSAIEVFKKNDDIDLVLLDIQLPEISGYQVAREMKQIREFVPIIAQTAYASLEDKKKCLLAGCTDYLRKPVDSQDLLAKIATAFNKS